MSPTASRTTDLGEIFRDIARSALGTVGVLDGAVRIADGFESVPTASSINWYTAGQTVANMAIATVTPPNGGISIQGGGGGRSHLVIDVLGFVA